MTHQNSLPEIATTDKMEDCMTVITKEFYYAKFRVHRTALSDCLKYERLSHNFLHMSDIIFILIVTCTIPYILSTQST